MDCVRLTSDVALVGGGNFGFSLTSPGDCNVYLIDGGDELALVDAGIGGTAGSADRILETITADGYDPARISHLLLTHYHADHAGGAAEMRDRLSCAVHGSPLTAKTLETADEAQISLPAARDAGFFPADYRLQACPCTGDLVEGETFQVGRLTVTPIDTPGHADGHVSLLVEGGDRTYLIQGDVVFFGGTILLQKTHDCSIQKYADSVARLNTLEFDAFLPGHLGISLANGKRHIDAAHAIFSKLGVPRNLG
jgi:glyoxylase-like metal-dependent hydrolase (beta-lactamase superfamily II)